MHIEAATGARSSYQNEKVRVVPSNEMVASVYMQNGCVCLHAKSHYVAKTFVDVLFYLMRLLHQLENQK